jgi:hypothetical protein
VGGHKPSIGEAQAESDKIAERVMAATTMTWLIERTRLPVA